MSLAMCRVLQAQTLYVATGMYGTNSSLYSVNPTTGGPTAIGQVKVGSSNVGIAGLAFHPETNVLFGVTNAGATNPNCLVIIDPTGAATVVGSLGGSTTISDISFSTTGVLYGWANNTSALATIDLTTGAATVLSTTFSGSTDSTSGGLGFSYDGTLYLAPNSVDDHLWTVNNAASPATVTQGPSLHDGITTHPSNYFNSLAYSVTYGAMYGIGAYTFNGAAQTYLVSINPSNGLWTLVGNLPDYSNAVAFASTYTTWRKARFSSTELLDSNVSGPAAVYGLDGLPNMVKYALGLDPKTNITTGLPAVTTDGTDWLFTYTRPARLGDVSYSVEVSTDLSTWTTTGVTHEQVSSGGTTQQPTQTWHGRYSLSSATNAFFRLNAKLVSTTLVTATDAVFDGSPHGGTAAVSGTDLSLSLTVTYTGILGTTYGPSTAAPTALGNYSASASYAGDAVHTGSSDSRNFKITSQ